jgi:sarcosine oxidase subunit beta
MATTFDAIIIGGGIMGCSSAYELARRGLSVALLEKGTVGEGPTGESSAIIRQHYSNELTARMALHSLRAFSTLKIDLAT